MPDGSSIRHFFLLISKQNPLGSIPKLQQCFHPVICGTGQIAIHGYDDIMLRNRVQQMNEPVLLLNANYEPLNVCTTKRAMGLLVTGKAEMLLNGRGYVRTVRLSIPRPSIIRLGYMVKRPRPKVKLTKQEIFRRDRYTCQYCGTKAKGLTIDHVIPRYRGGQHSWSNLVTACPECNRKKGGRTLSEARMRLINQPREPQATAIYIYGSYLNENEIWRDYLTGW